ncbi:uncharacterized protein LOC123515916 isoform X1 [Portunus trituberculatus]|uniref:uncharacterized protein LOC123515916 isoform X1 n=1 Tax=Portunus trituberculatus TaxID=210409 RepID=UPI001E1D03D9|nr:uncharacterized protein LOC123515916 isoform X1 [Portunus trituberculatus]
MASTALRILMVICAVSLSSAKLTVLSEDGELHCEAEGRFRHPESCDQYVDCIPQGKYFEPHVGSCKGAIFNEDAKKCLNPSKQDTNCTFHDRHARALPMDPNYDFMCEDIQSGFFCMSCKTLVNCVNGRAYMDDCDAGHTCDMRDTFGGGVCYPNSPEICQCQNQRELLPDPYSPQAYLECQAGNLDPNVEFCKKDMVFKEEDLMCQYPVGYVECTKHGIFPNPNDCTEYYKCMPVARGLIQYTFSCSCGLLFNDLTGKCEDPCSYQPEDFICYTEGRFPDEYNCHKFYLCIADSFYDSGFHQSHHSCPQNSFWKPGQIEGTGSCQVSTDNTECFKLQAPKCAVPVGRNCTDYPNIIQGGECIQGSPNCLCNSANGDLYCEEGYASDGETCVPAGAATTPGPV